MELLLSADEADLLLEILADQHRELLREIAHTSHHDFKISLRHREASLDTLIKRLAVLQASSVNEALAG